jgi:glycosyltransferase involved in cell wall biosynthesis
VISVLLPARNAGSTLASALRSVERQTLRDWECVVVDDGSSDGTAAIARAFAARDPRFRLVRGPAEGLVPALTAGLAACRGDRIARMDADDLMHRRRLQRQAKALAEQPGWSATGCHVRLFPRGALGDGYRSYERWINGIRSADCVTRESWIECPVAHPGLMLRRESLDRLGYRDRGWPEDYDLVLRLLRRGERIGIVPERLLSWRHLPERLSRTDAAYSAERFTACKAHHLARSFLAGSSGYLLWGYGGTGRSLRRALAEHGKQPTHVVELHPRRLGNRIHGAPVVPRTELAELPRRPLVVSVAGAAARGQIREFLAGIGFVELRDYVCAA